MYAVAMTERSAGDALAGVRGAKSGYLLPGDFQQGFLLAFPAYIFTFPDNFHEKKRCCQTRMTHVFFIAVAEVRFQESCSPA